MRFFLALFISFWLAAPVAADYDKTLHVYIWSEYIPNEVIQNFTKETGIKVTLSSFDSNEAMFAKLQLLGGKGGYDLIVPSSYYVSKLKKADLLLPLDKNKIPNLKNIAPHFLNQAYDPDNAYSVPYLWEMTGIVYNQKYIKEPVESWNILFDAKYKNKLLLLDDVREAFSIALIALGYNSNDTDAAHLEAAYNKLKTLLPNVKIWNSESPKVLFINEEVILGTAWNGEAYMASLANPDVKFAMPKEGPILCMDNFAILKSSKHQDNAYQFINFILRPEVAKVISEKMGYSTPNAEALKIIDPKILNNPIAYPPQEYVSKGVFMDDVGVATPIYAKYWEKLRTGGEK